MRAFGGVLVLVGILGFIYTGDQLAKYEPLSSERTLRESVNHPAGRWEIAHYGAALVGAVGLLLALYPKGR